MGQIQLEFLGSGGAVTTPRPLCHCPVCDQARALGRPYARTGPSVYLHGPDLLFDTPEESKEQLNRAGIERIAGCFYSHWHPDHTMGRRVLESLFLGMYRQSAPWRRSAPEPVPVYLPPQVAQDFDRFMALGEHFRYMSERGWVTVQRMAEGEVLRFGDMTLEAIPLAASYVYAFLLEAGGRRTLIAMDELVGWQPAPELRGVDTAVLPMGIVEFDPFSGRRRIPPDHPILREEATYAQTLDIVRALAPGAVYFAHIEEPDGLSYDDLLCVQANLRSEGIPATFGYDGLKVGL